MKYAVRLAQTVIETTTLFVEAHNEDQAELIAQYIVENGKDPYDRKFIEVVWRADEVRDQDVLACAEFADDTPCCNTMPEHAEGLFKDEEEV